MYVKFIKRFLDIFFSFVALVLLSPFYLLLIIMVAIKLGFPVHFKQVRPGINGKLFVMYKFRTMSNQKDENGKLLSDEKRLTKFGNFLRKTSLDELPELINILKGNMSIIGPRPLLVKDYVFFDERVMRRQSIKPGLSGLAQVNGRNNISWEKKFSYDLEYINKQSFLLDASLVFKTIFKAFLKQENVNRDGFATDVDYGDYLLSKNAITIEEYRDKVLLSEKMIENFIK